MTATDELRRLLDERGVGTYKHEVPAAVCLAFFDGKRWHDCWESTGGEVNVTFSMTPEQAVAATLGRGTCHDTGRYCFTCSECGLVANEPHHALGGFWPNYCSNCGRRIEEGRWLSM